LFGGRVAKDDLAVEAYGTVDETVAALGVARAELDADGTPLGLEDLAPLILGLQRALFVAGAELATNPTATARLQDGVTRVDEAMLVAVEADLATWEGRITMPREFVVPGQSRLSAAIEVARVTCRRAERRVITARRAGHATGEWLVPWLNRVADLLWVLARAAEQAEGAGTTAASVAARRRTARRPAIDR
jgi:cob(I)alamin adenosyltransferase